MTEAEEILSLIFLIHLLSYLFTKYIKQKISVKEFQADFLFGEGTAIFSTDSFLVYRQLIPLLMQYFLISDLKFVPHSHDFIPTRYLPLSLSR